MTREALSAVVVSLMLGALLMGCAQSDSQPTAELTNCSEPRPQMCTKEYLPVCASRDTGVRCITTPCPSAEWKTYGNACEACADPKVIGHKPGACEGQ